MTTSISIERRRLRARLALSLSTVLCSGLAAPALAQTAPPQYVDVDVNGVDLVSGNFVTSVTEGSIGSGEGAISLTRTRNGASNWVGNWTGGLVVQTVGSATTAYAIFGPSSDAFSVSGTTYTSLAGKGATLVGDGSGYLYTASDGTKIIYALQDQDGNPVSGFGCAGYGFNCAIPVQVTKPDGMTFTIDWTYSVRCATRLCPSGTAYYRLNGVTSSAGYGFTVQYVTNTAGTGSTPQTNWYLKTSVTFSNSNNAPASPPVVTYPTPSASYPDFTDPAGRAWHFGAGNGTPLTSIQRPGASAASTSISYSGTPSYVSSISVNGVTTNYSRVVNGSTATATTTITDALSHQTIAVADLTKGRVTQLTEVLSTGNRVTGFTYDANSRLTEKTNPELDKIDYAYDARGNVTSTTRKAKPSSGLADIVTSANYPSSCTNVACNSPTFTTDALLHQTDYSYDTTTGFVTSVKSPAATTGGTRPETRYSYTPVSGVTVLTGVSSCQTGTAPSCVGTSDEVKTTIGYNSNLLPSSVSKSAGDGSLTATVASTYDPVGNLATVDGPLAGTSDTTTYRYDADRERTGVISADPDGAGPLKRRAVKTAYNNDGQPTVTEIGTVNGTTDTDWAAFVTLQQSTASYDANARKTTDVLTAGGTTYGVTQYSYEALGRLECSALRMNSATWSSLPTSACTLGTAGSAGPDRITKTTYDGVGEATKVQSAYGTADQADDATGTYNGNGTLATLTDAQVNTTTYAYDGFDRLAKTSYPFTTAGSGTSSTTDYEQLAYDAGSRVTSRRLRDATSIGYGYDALNRLVTKNLPGSELDVTYSYDLSNRPLSAATSAQTLSFTYDALNRNLTQTGPLGTMTSVYDSAGRRTRLTWPDAFYVSPAYLVTGEVATISDNASTPLVLATYGYDDLGRRTSLTLGNGTATTYTPDAVSRLSSLGLNLAGTASDLTLGFSYNPASQIASTMRSNDTYAWTASVNRNDANAVNGLNQVTSVGATSIAYDARGNLASNGANGYTYSSENLLLTGPSSAALIYDPLMRLYQESGSSVPVTKFLYDGQAIVGEYNSGGTLQKRYVHGPGSDEPLVEYNGSGTRTWLHADERGSIIARSDDTGAKTAINAYDEYGVPASGNVGRFGYTGQAWLPSLGLSYYKARMYAPTLGRFMQTDPIGYGDGMNWYGYVGGDAVNLKDPAGQCALTWDDVFQVFSDGHEKKIGTQNYHFIGADCYKSDAGGAANRSVDTANNAIGGLRGTTSDQPQNTFHPDKGYADPSDVDIIVIGALSGVSEAILAEDIVVTASRGWFSRLVGRLFGRSACFAAGTLVQTAHGLRAIETIKLGDMVLSRDEKTDRTAYKRVTAVKTPAKDELYTVELDVPAEKTAEHHANFEATASHPWRSLDGRWVPTAQLRRGMKLVRFGGAPALVESVHDTARKAPTYNLTVAGYHTYFVGQDHLWVHNACDPNKLLHIFGNPGHNLGGLVSQFGSEEAAFEAMQSATQAEIGRQGINGVFETAVNVGGQSITVRGNVINGAVKIGTAFR